MRPDFDAIFAACAEFARANANNERAFRTSLLPVGGMFSVWADTRPPSVSFPVDVDGGIMPPDTYREMRAKNHEASRAASDDLDWDERAFGRSLGFDRVVVFVVRVFGELDALRIAHVTVGAIFWGHDLSTSRDVYPDAPTEAPSATLSRAFDAALALEPRK